ncbi:MAG TPA: hypothetical protein VD766_08620, partial [Solirubrobacterales bacterium]|nr:hypothetical protein [Solirubrobacterales bacterium]
TLLTGFWAQLVSGAVLILLAPLLIRTLSTAPAGANRRSGPKPARLRKPSFRGSKRPSRTAEAPQ